MIFHQCFVQSQIAAGKRPPLPTNKKWCTCRQEVSDEEAKELMLNGEAVNVVIERTQKPIQVTCDLCKGDKTVKNCAQCRGTGEVTRFYTVDTYGDDIVAVSVAIKTPRVATTESKHIYRAYVNGMKGAQERIEIYGESTLNLLAELGAELRTSRYSNPPNQVVKPGKPEPEDDQKKGTGRRFDYGRAVRA